MQSERNAEVYRYWSSLRQMRAAPLRSDFDPIIMRRRLPDLFMLDWHATDLQFRLAGTRLCERFGEELRGRNFLSLWDWQSRDTVLEAALSALRTEETVVIDICLENDAGRFSLEMLLMPIRASGRLADRLLGSLFLVGQTPPHAPAQFQTGTMRLGQWLPICETRPPASVEREIDVFFDTHPMLRRLAEAARLARRLW